MTGLKEAAMRARTMPAMLCQLTTDDTLVPPNLSTTQVRLSSGTASVEHRISIPGRPTALLPLRQSSRIGAGMANRLRRCRAVLFLTGARRVRLPLGSKPLCRVCRLQRLWGAFRCAPTGDRSRAILRPPREIHRRYKNVRLRVHSLFEETP